MAIRILPYSTKSESALVLREAVGDCKFLKRRDSNYKVKEEDILINWGSSIVPDHINEHILNKREAVRNSIDKNKAYELFNQHKVPTPQKVPMEDMQIGMEYIERTTMKGADGAGVELFQNRYPKQGAEVFEYCKVSSEYRIVVFRGSVLHIHKKLCDHPIKTTANGVRWSQRNKEAFSDAFLNTAIEAVRALGLDFGGVDIAQTDKGIKVFEVNTAFEVTPAIQEELVKQIERLVEAKALFDEVINAPVEEPKPDADAKHVIIKRIEALQNELGELVKMVAEL